MVGVWLCIIVTVFCVVGWLQAGSRCWSHWFRGLVLHGKFLIMPNSSNRYYYDILIRPNATADIPRRIAKLFDHWYIVQFVIEVSINETCWLKSKLFCVCNIGKSNVESGPMLLEWREYRFFSVKLFFLMVWFWCREDCTVEIRWQWNTLQKGGMRWRRLIEWLTIANPEINALSLTLRYNYA